MRCTLSALLVACSVPAQFPSHFGNSCGGATVEHTGNAIPGGSVYLEIASVPSQSVATVLLVGLNRRMPPVPLAPLGFGGNCDVLVDQVALHTLNVLSGNATYSFPIPPGFSSNIDVHSQVLSLTPTLAVLGSDGLTVPIDSTPPSITGLSSTTASTLSPLIIQGQFDRDFQHHCVDVNGSLGIITSGSANQLTMEVQPFGAVSAGPVVILEGEREQIPASVFVPLPGAPAPQSMTVFSGTPSPTTMGMSTQNITVQPTPGFTPFGSSFVGGSTVTYSFAGGCQMGDCLRVWMRIYENGKCHDIYFTENGSWVGKSLQIPSNMSANFCAAWATGWLLQSLQSRIPGFNCNIVGGDTIEITVSNGTGITDFKGGFWISTPPC